MTTSDKFTRVNCSRALAYGVMVFGAVLTIAGCSPSPGNGEPPAARSAPAANTPATTASTGAPAILLDRAKLLADIAGARDMFAWYNAYTRCKGAGVTDPEVNSALSKAREALLKKKPAMAITDSLDLVAFDWKLDGTESVEGKNETFVVHWLYFKKGGIKLGEDQGLRLVVRGWLDKAFLHYYTPDQGQNPRYFEMTWKLNPNMDAWKTGEYHLVTQKTYRPIPNVPYRIYTYLAAVKKADDGVWRGKGTYGKSLDLGWHADLGQESAKADTPK